MISPRRIRETSSCSAPRRRRGPARRAFALFALPLVLTALCTEPAAARLVYTHSVNDVTSYSDIWRLDESGTTALTSGLGHARDPRYSPTGTHIAFGSDATGRYQIYVMDADGANVRNLSNNVARETAPSWSPGGQRIVFVSNGDIWTMASDGSDRRKLTNLPFNNLGFPTYSPSGDTIAYSDYTGFHFHLWTMDTDGTNQRQLSDSQTESAYGPAYSPDGSQIAYTGFGRQTGPNTFSDPDIFVRNADGSGAPVNLTPSGGSYAYSDGLPAWSPDGSTIAFGSNRPTIGSSPAPGGLFTVASSGGLISRLTSNPVGQGDFAPWYDPTGGSPPARLTLTPETQSVQIGTPATVTARLLSDTTGVPVPGTALSFRVSAGPNAGATGQCLPAGCVADAGGYVQFSYSAAHEGADTLTAWDDRDGDDAPSAGEPRATVTITWSVRGADTAFVALGDSYSSGEGLNPFLPPSDANGCHRSSQAYGPVLAREYALGELTFAACSGATTDHLLTGRGGERPQIPAADAESTTLGPRTRLVTLTVGGNDVGFEGVLRDCVQGPHSPGGPGCAQRNEAAVQARIARLAGSLDAAFDGDRPIHRVSDVLAAVHAAAPNATVYIAGYPVLFGSPAKLTSVPRTKRKICNVGSVYGLIYAIDGPDVEWLNQVAKDLNQAIADEVAVARAAGVDAVYVSPVRRFRKHGLCDTATPWINGVIPDTVAKEADGASFHPTAEGQRLGYAQAFHEAGVDGS